MENTTKKNESLRVKVQRFGAKLSAMVMPNIGVFIGWGLLTALFFPNGWIPNENLGALIDPTMKYLIPVLIGYSAGYNEYKTRGGVIGAFATMGVVIGAEINMLIAGMVMGPIAAILLKKVDEFLKPKTKAGMEMLVDNFSLGILGILLMIAGYLVVEPVMTVILAVLSTGANWVVERGLIPLAGIFVPPAQVLFLNNAINHGIMIPLGILEASEVGKSILFFVEALPGNWIGLLLAYTIFGVGTAKRTAPAALAILFFGGIGEPAYPFALINPLTILGPIFGSITQLTIATIFNGGLIGPLSPGSIFSFLAMTQRGDYFANILAYAGGVIVSFAVTALVLKRTTSKEQEKVEQEESAVVYSGAADTVAVNTEAVSSTGTLSVAGEIQNVVFACDAGMGSSAMGAAILQNKLRKAMLDVKVDNVSLDDIPDDYDLLLTSNNLVDRVLSIEPESAERLVSVENLLDEEEYDGIVELIKGNNQ